MKLDLIQRQSDRDPTLQVGSKTIFHANFRLYLEPYEGLERRFWNLGLG